jgi:hypothetical protein
MTDIISPTKAQRQRESRSSSSSSSFATSFLWIIFFSMGATFVVSSYYTRQSSQRWLAINSHAQEDTERCQPHAHAKGSILLLTLQQCLILFCCCCCCCCQETYDHFWWELLVTQDVTSHSTLVVKGHSVWRHCWRGMRWRKSIVLYIVYVWKMTFFCIHCFCLVTRKLSIHFIAIFIWRFLKRTQSVGRYVR